METTDSYLKMSVLNAITTLHEFKNIYPNKSIDELIEIIRGLKLYKSNYNYEVARKLICDYQIEVVNDLKCLITLIVQKELPSWLYQLHFGREIVASCLRDNQQIDILQCLKSAGLFEKEPDTSVVEWWDQLAGFARSFEDNKKLKSGRMGEILTLEYEAKRIADLNMKPKWISIENNFAGYDVISFESNSLGLKHKFIEVKACSSRPISFYLTQNEWNSALNFGDNYYFHIWYIPKRKLIELKASQVQENIPLNRGLGEWQNAFINIDSFFSEYY